MNWLSIITKIILRSFNNIRTLLIKFITNNNNILSIFFILGLIFLFIKSFNFYNYNIVDMIFCFFISFIVSYFILSKFKFSNNFLISFIQKIVIFFLAYFVLFCIFHYLGLIETIYCMGPEDEKFMFEIKSEISNKILSKFLTYRLFEGSNLIYKSIESFGAASADGTAAAAMAKASFGMANLHRVALVGSTGFITIISAGVIFGIKGANAVVNQVGLKNLRDLYLKSKHSNPNINRIPSPDGIYINSRLEDQTPLGNLIDVIFSYNMLEFIIMILLIYIIFNKKILIVISKYIPIKYNNLNMIVNRSINANTKIMNIVIIILVVLLLLFKLINLFFSYELLNNLDSYVNIYNEIKQILYN